MSTHTSIEWTDRTWNPVTGCSEISPGCAHCYAAKQTATRLSKHPAYKGLAIIDPETKSPRFTGEIRAHADRLQEPLHWRKSSRVFVNSMSDLFHEGVPEEFIDRVFAVMAFAWQHTFQVLTKRPERMREYLKYFNRDSCIAIGIRRVPGLSPTFQKGAEEIIDDRFAFKEDVGNILANVWLGVTTENQRFADERIPALLSTPAAVRFISAEPLLSPLDLRYLNVKKMVEVDALNGTHGVYRPHGGNNASLDWVICGGESGPEARPMHPEWARSLRDQCAAAGVPFFFKQWGAWLPIERHGYRPRKRAGQLHPLRIRRLTEIGEVDELVYHAYPKNSNDDNGIYWEMVNTTKKHRSLDGREHNEFPKAATAKAMMEQPAA